MSDKPQPYQPSCPVVDKQGYATPGYRMFWNNLVNQAQSYLAGVVVAGAGAVTGDGTTGSPLAVSVDGTSVVINGSNQLSAALVHTRVVIPHASILTLPTTTFVQLLPAPGAGKLIVPVGLWLRAKIVAGYTNINADAYLNPHLGAWSADIYSYLTNGNGTGLTDVSNWLSAAGTRQWNPLSYAQGAGAPGVGFATDWGLSATLLDVTAETNQPLILYCDNNGAGNFTGGNVGNSIVGEILSFTVTV